VGVALQSFGSVGSSGSWSRDMLGPLNLPARWGAVPKVRQAVRPGCPLLSPLHIKILSAIVAPAGARPAASGASPGPVGGPAGSRSCHRISRSDCASKRVPTRNLKPWPNARAADFAWDNRKRSIGGRIWGPAPKARPPASAGGRSMFGHDAGCVRTVRATAQRRLGSLGVAATGHQDAAPSGRPMGRAGQWLRPLPASSRSRITASRLNEAGFCRGGNFTKFSIWLATTACIM